MRKFIGYFKTMHNYLQTPKGRHDFLDYFWASIIIFISIVGVLLLVKAIGEKLL